MAAYEVLNTFVSNSALDSLPVVAKLSDVLIERLENTIPMQQQVVSVEDRITLEEIQTSLSSGLLVGLLPTRLCTGTKSKTVHHTAARTGNHAPSGQDHACTASNPE